MEWDLDGNIIEVEKQIVDENNRKLDIKNFNGDLSLKWKVTSYSELDEHQASGITTDCHGLENEYDEFVFSLLPRGAGAGNLIHNLLEKCDFQEVDEVGIGDEFVKFVGVDNASEMFVRFLKHIAKAKYCDSSGECFNLTEVNNVFKEEEFYFSFDEFAKDKLSKNKFTKNKTFKN
jgi:ATP-dependent exoDNAse (exonuclease V) beta subunit